MRRHAIVAYYFQCARAYEGSNISNARASCKNHNYSSSEDACVVRSFHVNQIQVSLCIDLIELRVSLCIVLFLCNYLNNRFMFIEVATCVNSSLPSIS